MIAKQIFIFTIFIKIFSCSETDEAFNIIYEKGLNRWGDLDAEVALIRDNMDKLGLENVAFMGRTCMSQKYCSPFKVEAVLFKDGELREGLDGNIRKKFLIKSNTFSSFSE